MLSTSLVAWASSSPAGERPALVALYHMREKENSDEIS